MLKNAYLLAKIGADTAENERHFAENLPKISKLANARASRPKKPTSPTRLAPGTRRSPARRTTGEGEAVVRARAFARRVAPSAIRGAATFLLTPS